MITMLNMNKVLKFMLYSQFVFESWGEMEEDERMKRENGELTMVDRLYLSMPSRIHQIQMRAGGRADY